MSVAIVISGEKNKRTNKQGRDEIKQDMNANYGKVLIALIPTLSVQLHVYSLL